MLVVAGGSEVIGVVEGIDGSLGASGPAPSIFELSSSFISTGVVDCGLELGRSVPSSTPVDCVDDAIGRVWGIRCCFRKGGATTQSSPASGKRLIYIGIIKAGSPRQSGWYHRN